MPTKQQWKEAMDMYLTTKYSIRFIAIMLNVSNQAVSQRVYKFLSEKQIKKVKLKRRKDSIKRRYGTLAGEKRAHERGKLLKEVKSGNRWSMSHLKCAYCKTTTLVNTKAAGGCQAWIKKYEKR